MMPTATYYEKAQRSPVFEDNEGFLVWTKGEDTTEDFVLDWTDRLDGDTISTSSWDMDGPTSVSESNTTTSATIFVSGSSGRMTNTITTAGGRTLVRKIKLRARSDDEVRRGYE